MAPREIQQKNEQQLRVIQIDENQYYVEDPNGKVIYKVNIDNNRESCTCENFQKIAKTDNSFKCNHILAVKNCVPSGEIGIVEHAERKKPKLDERFIKNIEGKDFVLYSGLLDLAHQLGLSKISVQILQYPTPENKNWAICTATVESSQFGTFIDIGDASPENCNARISRHLIRMASTRAKARALRDFTNIGMTCLEELSDINEVVGEDNSIPIEKSSKSKSERTRKPKSRKSSDGATPDTLSPSGSKGVSTGNSKIESENSTRPETGNGGNNGGNKLPRMSNAQERAILNLSRRKGISEQELEKISLNTFNTHLKFLSVNDASAFIFQLQQQTT